MASPMRKRRVWSTPEDDAQSRESAAFEASVAAAKDTAAKSGAFLSSAKEDLTDHQRWLRAQSAAVEKDRLRHERWLQRQHDQENAALRKERIRRRRRLMRQRAMQAVEQAALDLVLFVRSWIAFVFGKIGGGFKFAALSIGRGFSFVGEGIRWTAAKFGIAIRGAGKGLSAGAAWSEAKARASANAGGAALAASSSAVTAEAGKFSRFAGSSIGGGLSNAKVKAANIASSTGRAVAQGITLLAARASGAATAGKRGLSSMAGWTSTRAAALAPVLYVQMARFGHKVQDFTRARAPGSQPPLPAPPSSSPPLASVHVIEVYGPHPDGIALFGRPANEPLTLEPSIAEVAGAEPSTAAAEALGDPRDDELYGPSLGGGRASGVSPGEVAANTTSAAAQAWVHGIGAHAAILGVRARAMAGRAMAWLVANTAGAWRWAKGATRASTEALVRAKNQAQDLARTRGVDLSQMMIVAGAVLLVCGGLLVGGGLLMRAGARAPVTVDIPNETFSGITWMFNEPDIPLPERAVFTLSGTPQAFLINGLSVSGINNADQALMAVEAVLKPDVQRPDLKLALQMDAPEMPAGEGTQGAAADGPASTSLPSDAVPARTPFRLVFAFPPEAMDGADGISTEEFFESYGGLFLTLRYEIDGVEKSVFQYLAPDMLKAQLDEVPAYAEGS